MQIHGVLLCAHCSVFQQIQQLVRCCAAGTTAETGPACQTQWIQAVCLDVCATHRKAARIPQVVVAPLI